jgi:putative ABC transport system substrate-binding protein
VAAPFAAQSRVLSQGRGKLPRIGVLVSASPPHPFAGAFRRGLQNLGYKEGQNLTMEWRYTEGRRDRANELPVELVKLGVDIIVAHFTPAVGTAMAATKTIPIVMAPAGGPLQSGFIASLARPGGNVTGPIGHGSRDWRQKPATAQRPNTCPHLCWILASTATTDPFGLPFVEDIQSAGAGGGIRIVTVMVDSRIGFEQAFAVMARAQAVPLPVVPLSSRPEERSGPITAEKASETPPPPSILRSAFDPAARKLRY